MSWTTSEDDKISIRVYQTRSAMSLAYKQKRLLEEKWSQNRFRRRPKKIRYYPGLRVKFFELLTNSSFHLNNPKRFGEEDSVVSSTKFHVFMSIGK